MPDIALVHGTVAEVGDLPAAEFEGRLFYVSGTDPGLYRDNGATWDLVAIQTAGGGSGPRAYHIDLDYDHIDNGIPDTMGGWFEFGTPSTIGTIEHARHFSRVGPATAGMRGSAGTKPTGTSYTVEWGLVPHLIANEGAAAGVAMMESSSGQIFIELYYDGTLGWVIREGLSTGYTSSPTVGTVVPLGFMPPIIFFRFTTTDDVNFIPYYSFDGRVWTALETINSAGTLTSVLNQGFYWRNVATDTDPIGIRLGVSAVHHKQF